MPKKTATKSKKTYNKKTYSKSSKQKPDQKSNYKPSYTKSGRPILSAGRCQSPTLFIINERNKEIENFKPEEYFDLKLKLEKSKTVFFANRVFKGDDKSLADKIKTKYEQLKKIKVTDVVKSKKSQNPQPPFETQTALSSITKRFKIKPDMAMSILQSLYEKGAITYHRTDSTRVSDDGIKLAKSIINKIDKTLFKENKGKAGSQDAHECIRPTHAEAGAELNDLETKVYNFITDRFIVSQMRPLLYEETKILFEDNFTSIGKNILDKGFKGYKNQDDVQDENNKEPDLLPDIKKGEILPIKNIEKLQKFTQPPAYFNVSTIINELKKRGIGRPSTYSTIINTLFNRGYAMEQSGKLYVTDIGSKVLDFLYNQTKVKYISVEYTKEMEEFLDRVASGKEKKDNIIKYLENIYINVY